MDEIDYKTVLDRKLDALFPNPERRMEALKLLQQYGTEQYEREADRVRVAILKLSGKKMEKIRQFVATARQDYRDVLAYAEYPNQMSHDTWNLTAEANTALQEADLAQYRRWLNE